MNSENLRQRCDALLIAMMGKDLAIKWWSSPNRAFGGGTPQNMFDESPTAVYAYLLKSAEGEW